MKFPVILTPDCEDGGYTAECPAIPGCISEGNTIEEALANIKGAIAGCMESLVARRESLQVDSQILISSVEVSVPNMG